LSGFILSAVATALDSVFKTSARASSAAPAVEKANSVISGERIEIIFLKQIVINVVIPQCC
jgi:hypothetical protein